MIYSCYFDTNWCCRSTWWCHKIALVLGEHHGVNTTPRNLTPWCCHDTTVFTVWQRMEVFFSVSLCGGMAGAPHWWVAQTPPGMGGSGCPHLGWGLVMASVARILLVVI